MTTRQIVPLITALFVGAVYTSAHADITQSTWSPLFVGIYHATGTMTPTNGNPRLQKVNALRIDLHAPGISFFTTPANITPVDDATSSYFAANSLHLETVTQKTTDFVDQYNLAVAINANFWSATPNSFYTQTNADLNGLAISQGTVVSGPRYPDSSDYDWPSLVINAANQAQIISKPKNGYPSDTFTAVSGIWYVLTNGATGATGGAVHPRTAVGLDQSANHLYLLTVDGRQPGISEGATAQELGQWLLRFGAYTGINLDGGGSTSMAYADSLGNPHLFNIPGGASDGSPGPGTERYNGNNFGVFAAALPIPEPASLTLFAFASTTLLVRRKSR